MDERSIIDTVNADAGGGPWYVTGKTMESRYVLVGLHARLSSIESTRPHYPWHYHNSAYKSDSNHIIYPCSNPENPVTTASYWFWFFFVPRRQRYLPISMTMAIEACHGHDASWSCRSRRDRCGGAAGGDGAHVLPNGSN